MLLKAILRVTQNAKAICGSLSAESIEEASLLSAIGKTQLFFFKANCHKSLVPCNQQWTDQWTKRPTDRRTN